MRGRPEFVSYVLASSGIPFDGNDIVSQALVAKFWFEDLVLMVWMVAVVLRFNVWG